MKATMNATGQLIITPQNQLEQYALTKWVEEEQKTIIKPLKDKTKKEKKGENKNG